MASTQLVVQADDFGMCHGVNLGIVRAFRAGIVTQSSMMAPCPWVFEAMALAREHGIPVGVHCTLACEWEHFRWGPLTGGPSLRAADGGFPRSTEAAREQIVLDEAVLELEAQVERLLAGGLRPSYLDGHMHETCPEAFTRIGQRYGLPCVHAYARPFIDFTSRAGLSSQPAQEKTSWLLAWIDALEPGCHLLYTHPAQGEEELRALTPQEAPNHSWAESRRVSDLDTLLDPRVAALIAARQIELVSVQGLPVHH
jgi:predicted glycoside hydrolase/deacetylase ChbG (UPF0249 family)